MQTLNEITAKAHEKRLVELRRERKRIVKAALAGGWRSPFDLRTLIEDGWSLNTIRKVVRVDS